MAKLLSTFRRVGITGSSRAGKTVFLLSLIQHLKAGALNLTVNKKAIGISNFHPMPRNDKKLFAEKKREFDYEKLIAHLAADEDWPKKTTDSFFYRCRFERSDNPICRTELEFFDFPGERAADVTMIGKNFREWSDRMLKSITDDPTKARHASRFREAAESPVLSESELVDSYKESLARFVLDYHSLISPSTFLIDGNGKEARGETASEIVAGTAYTPPLPRFSGLEDAEFTPLPAVQFKKNEQLYRKFADHYKRYRREVVDPLTMQLLGCHKLIFLIDIADVLGSGVSKCNDTQFLIEDLLNYIDEGMSVFKRVNRKIKDCVQFVYGRKSGWIEQIAFVASKADKVHEDDRENLKTLLTDLVEPLTRNSELAKKAAFYNCISVNSTQSLKDGDHILFGRPIWKREDDGGVRKLTPSDPPQQLKVSQLPSHWPDRWSGADYSFYDFYPTIPAKRGNLPKQNGLERVMEFILNGVEETK